MCKEVYVNKEMVQSHSNGKASSEVQEQKPVSKKKGTKKAWAKVNDENEAAGKQKDETVMLWRCSGRAHLQDIAQQQDVPVQRKVMKSAGMNTVVQPSQLPSLSSRSQTNSKGGNSSSEDEPLRRRGSWVQRGRAQSQPSLTRQTDSDEGEQSPLWSSVLQQQQGLKPEDVVPRWLQEKITTEPITSGPQGKKGQVKRPASAPLDLEKPKCSGVVEGGAENPVGGVEKPDAEGDKPPPVQPPLLQSPPVQSPPAQLPPGRAGCQLSLGSPESAVMAKVLLTDLRFVPSLLRLPSGGAVEWQVADDAGVAHSLHILRLDSRDVVTETAPVAPGQKLRWLFSEAGRYECRSCVYSFMCCSITVSDQVDTNQIETASDDPLLATPFINFSPTFIPVIPSQYLPPEVYTRAPTQEEDADLRVPLLQDQETEPKLSSASDDRVKSSSDEEKGKAGIRKKNGGVSRRNSPTESPDSDSKERARSSEKLPGGGSSADGGLLILTGPGGLENGLRVRGEDLQRKQMQNKGGGHRLSPTGHRLSPNISEPCGRCLRRFHSPLNRQRHMRHHHRRVSAPAEDLSQKRAALLDFWNAQPQEYTKGQLALAGFSMEGVNGQEVIEQLTSLMQHAPFMPPPGLLPFFSSALHLLDVASGTEHANSLSAAELFSALDEASEATFLQGGVSVPLVKALQGAVEGGLLNKKCLVATLALFIEARLLSAWQERQESEAMKAHEALVAEEEAAQVRRQQEEQRKERRRNKRSQKCPPKRPSTAEALEPLDVSPPTPDLAVPALPLDVPDPETNLESFGRKADHRETVEIEKIEERETPAGSVAESAAEWQRQATAALRSLLLVGETGLPEESDQAESKQEEESGSSQPEGGIADLLRSSVSECAAFLTDRWESAVRDPEAIQFTCSEPLEVSPKQPSFFCMLSDAFHTSAYKPRGDATSARQSSSNLAKARESTESWNRVKLERQRSWGNRSGSYTRSKGERKFGARQEGVRV